MARSQDGSATILAVWRDTGAPRPLTFASKDSLDPSVPFGSSTFTSYPANNGVDVAWDGEWGVFEATFAN